MNVENKETLTKIICHFMRFFKITDEDDCWRQLISIFAFFVSKNI